MQANFKPPFSKFVKKANRPLQLAIDDAVELICAEPEIGVLKQGDLSGVLVYKFKFNPTRFSETQPLLHPAIDRPHPGGRKSLDMWNGYIARSRHGNNQ